MTERTVMTQRYEFVIRRLKCEITRGRIETEMQERIEYEDRLPLYTGVKTAQTIPTEFIGVCVAHIRRQQELKSSVRTAL